jgi:hypothetical protein
VEGQGVLERTRVDKKLAQDSVEDENTRKDFDVGREREAWTNLGNASASHGATASLQKLDISESAQAINLSMEASGPAVGTKGESLHRGHVGEIGDSYVHGAYASQQSGQWKISNHSAAENSSGEAPVNPNKQDFDMIQEGRWVFDESYPLYTSNSCPFVDEGFSCEANGRMEHKYTKWRWQPTHCDIPRCGISISTQFHSC